MLLHSEPVHRNYLNFFQKFENIMRILTVNETIFTMKNAFNSDMFALRGEKELKYGKETFFLGCMQKLNMSVTL